MSNSNELIPNLFRTEYSKIVSVLCSYFGLSHVEIAEDIASEAFLLAAEIWPHKGIPANPQAWLYTVAKNKTIDYLKRNNLFDKQIKPSILSNSETSIFQEIEFNDAIINDSQLQMLFAICHPEIAQNYQVGLALRILCGFGIEEIANAFLSNKDTINKRLLRAKEKLRDLNISAQLPQNTKINERLDSVLKVIYLLFNEGYYSKSTNNLIRKELCTEAIRLCITLTNNNLTNQPKVNALLSLMCFNASRLDARLSPNGDIILFDEQNKNLWDNTLIEKGNYYLINSANGNLLSKYHIEAFIAFWHTQTNDSEKKWKSIYKLYEELLKIEYSSNIILSQLYALSKLEGNEIVIPKIEKLNLTTDVSYHSLLGDLYSSINPVKSIEHYNSALKLTNQNSIKTLILKKIKTLSNNNI